MRDLAGNVAAMSKSPVVVLLLLNVELSVSLIAANHVLLRVEILSYLVFGAYRKIWTRCFVAQSCRTSWTSSCRRVVVTPLWYHVVTHCS